MICCMSHANKRMAMMHQVAAKNNNDLCSLSIYSKLQLTISWYILFRVFSVDIDFVFEINNRNVNYSYYSLFLYMPEASRLVPRIHTYTHFHLVSRTAAKIGGVEQIRASSLSSLVERHDGIERTIELLPTEEKKRRRKWVFNNILPLLDAH